MEFKRLLCLLAVSAALALSGCDDGDDGAQGPQGPPGEPGAPGAPGAPAGSVSDSAGEASEVTISLDPANIDLSGAAPFSATFSLAGANSKGDTVPFTGFSYVRFYVLSEMANETGTGSPYIWVNHVTSNTGSTSMTCKSDGTEDCMLEADEENAGTYTVTWTGEGNGPVVMEGGDMNALHRVVIRAYGVSDAEGNGVSDKVLTNPIDFIPATGEAGMSMKDSVSNMACIQCHGMLEGYPEGDYRIANISAHHNYQKVENCVVCHNAGRAGGEDDPTKGFNADFGPMVHRIHAGHALADSLTGEAATEFGHIGFPAEISQCTVCHDNGDSWTANIGQEACEACHIDVDFATGVGHSPFDLAQTDDTQCMDCHSSGGIAPMMAHNVGARDAMKEAMALKIEVTDLEVIDDGVMGTDTLRATSTVTFNGAAAPDGLDLTPYMTSASRGLLIGNVDANGATTRGLGMKVTPTGGNWVSLTGGTLITELTGVADSQLMGSLYATAEVQVCGDGTMVVACGDDADLGIGFANDAPVYYENLSGGDATMARIDTPSMTTVDEATCNSCHENLTHVKGTHGADNFSQCMDCHNENWGGSFHPNLEAVLVDEDGAPILDGNGDTQAVIVAGEYRTRDLVTVAHRYHSGTWDNGSAHGVYAVQYPDGSTATMGYPAAANDCAACHIEDATFFAADGGLFSGKRAMNVGDLDGDMAEEYITPVTESCRSCHAHSNEAALSHFKSNGAIVAGDSETSSVLPVESCATCHAEGKTYGVDVVHGGSSH